MGMAASQARFLSLTARQSNVEFEGQQINQQRTTLSNESSNYYSQLCNMSVPTPPSSEDYTKTTYTFVDGNENNTINSLIAKKDGLYILNYTQAYETESVLSNGSVLVTKRENEGVEPTYYIGATKLRTLGQDDPTDAYLSSLPTAEKEQVLAMEATYAQLLKDKYGDEAWYVKYTQNSANGVYEPNFYNAIQIANADYSEKTGTSLSSIKSYTYGQTTETREIKNAQARVEQDTTGRFISIFICETDDEGNIRRDDKGNEIGSTYQLTTTTETDENAYNDAMNNYNYQKAQYEQSIQSINAQIEVIQAQDKDLELRLKQLDTEQSAISTELDSVKKVISKNVDTSFKAFSA